MSEPVPPPEGAFWSLVARMIDAVEQQVVRDLFAGTGPSARREALIAETRAVAAAKGWPLLVAADWVASFGLPHDVPVPKTGLAGLVTHLAGEPTADQADRF